MTKLRYIGRDRPRPDAPDKAAGRALYIHDLVRPGMLYGKVKFSEYAHARIVDIDTSRAEKLPGVRAVITGYNTSEIRIGFLKDNFALKKGKVRQFRDEVAAVAAVDPDTAAEAVDLIRVEYEPLPGVFATDHALSLNAPLVHETDPAGRPRKDNLLNLKFGHESGDIGAARKAAAFMAEGEFSTPLIQQSCMGTAGCIAEFDTNGNLTIRAKTQIPFLAQRDYLGALVAMGLRGKNARVIVPTLGGGFGTGLDTHAYEYIAILLAHKTGKPVKIVYTRDEEFANLSPRQSSRTRIVQGCGADGKLLFREVDVLLDNGAYTSWGATYPTVMMIPATSLYKVANVRFDARLVYTNNTYCQAMRGYGNPELAWGLEQNMDELARAAGFDPFEFRVINCNEPGEITPMGLKVGTCGLAECLDSVKEKLEPGAETAAGSGETSEAGSGETSEAGSGETSGAVSGETSGKEGGVAAGSRNGPKRRGRGMASLMHVGGSGRIYRSDGSGIILKLDDFGNVNVFYGGVEMGQGLHSVLILAVSEALGVRPGSVHINPTDTGTCPWDVGTHASRGAFMACHAAQLAADKLRAEIFTLAEKVFPAEIEKSFKKRRRKDPGFKPPAFDFAAAAVRDRIDLRDSVIFLKGAPDDPLLRLDLARFLRAIHFSEHGRMLTAEVFYEPENELPDFTKGRGNISACYAYGVQGAEVEVDTETGEVRILKMAAAHDVGKVLNPQAIRGQTYGALAQGVGYALYEEVRTSGGRILNTNFRDYKMPGVFELDFPIELDFIETDESAGPYGAKGVGEPGLVPTAPAIANAVYDAVGVRIRDLPITPEKVLAALRELERQED